jgi:hypothetical protein
MKRPDCPGNSRASEAKQAKKGFIRQAQDHKQPPTLSGLKIHKAYNVPTSICVDAK